MANRNGRGADNWNVRVMSDPLREILDGQTIKKLQAEVEELKDELAEYEDRFGIVVNKTGQLSRATMKEIIQRQTKTIKELREALEELVDNQNGPPLLLWQEDWNKAMRMSYKALGRDDKGAFDDDY